MIALSQISDHYFDYDNCKTSVGTNFSYEFNSNSITNKFLNTYLYGNHIDSLRKQWMFANLQPQNYFGADIEGGLSAVTFPDSFAGGTNMGLFVRYNRYYHVDLSFTDDLFKLFFDGNQRFAGETANLSNSSLNAVSYDQIQFGLFSKYSINNYKYTFGYGVSINNGYQNTVVNIKQGSLYTDANAEYIDFAANYDVARSSTPSKIFKGLGTSINFYYSIESPKKNVFDLQLTNLGFIRWNKQSQSFSKDTTIHFDGVNVTDILNIKGNIFGNANTDSIVHAYTYSNLKTSYYTLTQACLNISYLYNISERSRVDLFMIKKFFSHYDPCFIAKIQYLPNKKNVISLNLSYGGYSTIDISDNHDINVGLEYAHDFGKGLVVIVGSNYINGFIYPCTTTAQGAFFSLKKYFL